MELQLFGEINEHDVEDYYEVRFVYEDQNIEVDLNFEESSIDKSNLVRVNGLLSELVGCLQKAEAAISKDYDLGDAAETVQDYLNHHIDIFNDEEIEAIFGTKDVTKQTFLSALEAKRVGFYPEDYESFMLVDFTLKNDVTDYLICVVFNGAGELTDIMMESKSNKRVVLTPGGAAHPSVRLGRGGV